MRIRLNLNAGDTCAIPKGCRVEVKGDFICIIGTEEQEECQFKDGDYVTRQYLFRNTLVTEIFILKLLTGDFNSRVRCGYAALNADGCLHAEDCRHIVSDEEIVRHSTEEEIKQLQEKLHAVGRDWDAVNKRVIAYIPKALTGQTYYFIHGTSCTAMLDKNFGTPVDRERNECGNYFINKEECEKYAAHFRSILKERSLK